MIGSTLGPYEVVAKLGEGGMGEVYRARDRKLNRDVALKVLPAIVADDPDRLARFKREAHVLASLNHPNIAAIYGFEDSGPTHALVLELVEGPTLADRIASGPLPVGDAIAVAKQVADALAAAHEVGIIHRDLKPANIKVRDDGTVKVLDFGLAKALDPGGSGTIARGRTSTEQKGDGSRLREQDPSPSTMTSPAMTTMGMIIGTAAYMAPEQARGKAVDRRADLWAFGVVLYEMLTGRRAFEGPEVSDVLASVLKDTPSFDALPDDTPPGVRRLLRRTLEKDRSRRLDSMAAARLELDETGEGAPVAVATAPPADRRRVLVPAVATALVTALAVGAAVWRAMQPAPPEIRRFAITPTADAPIAIETNHNDVAITPDGTRVLYFSRIGQDNQLIVRPLDRFEPTILSKLGTDPRGLFASPDGEWVGFYSGTQRTAALSKVPIAGGAPVPIASVDGNLRGASWGANGTIIFATNARSGLFRVPAAGGEPEVLTTPSTADVEEDHVWPHLLPDGRHVLFSIARAANAFDVALLDLDTKTWRVLVKGGLSPRYAPTGHIVYGSAGALRAVRFDLDRLEVQGDPIEVVSGVTMKDSGAVDFALARNGTLVYLPGARRSAATSLAWWSADGTATKLAVPPADFRAIQVSPNGRLAVAVVGQGELWLIDLAREVSSRLTPAEFNAAGPPAWSRDSQRVAFWSAGVPGTSDGGIFTVPASGTAAPERLTSAPAGESHGPWSWTPGDTALLFTKRAAGSWDLMQVSLDASSTVTPVLAGPDVEATPALSPDGRWLAYMSFETRPQIFIRPYPDVGRMRIPVTTDGGTNPVWGRDGRTLYFDGPGSNEPLLVTVEPAGDTLSIGRAAPFPSVRNETNVFTGASLPPVDGRVLAPARDEAETRGSEYRVVLNWFEELRARVAR